MNIVATETECQAGWRLFVGCAKLNRGRGSGHEPQEHSRTCEEGGRRFEDPGVAAVFETYPQALREKLSALRDLIFETASATEGVGELKETLKWGQPSYLTTASKSGSTIRIDRVKSAPDRYAIYFHCQTNLVATFRELYPTEFTYEGNRSIVFEADEAVPQEALRHCLSLALPITREGREVSSHRARPKPIVLYNDAKRSQINQKATADPETRYTRNQEIP